MVCVQKRVSLQFEMTRDKNGPMLLLPWKFCQETKEGVKLTITEV